MNYVILFVFGLAIGSFMNVLALRYDGGHFLFDPRVIGGRSHCPHCKHTLQWYELIPVVSYLVQGGKCKNCGASIGFKYALVELLSALIFVFVPWQLAGYPLAAIVLWVAAFEVLLLIAYIDIRLEIVPDELTIILGVIAILETIFASAYLGNMWIANLEGAVFGGAFFAVLALATRGKGMGMGDVKLGIPLGFLFGWPIIALLYAVAFIVGSIVGLVLIARGQKTRKSAVPFVPFLSVAAAIVFFFASAFFSWYFRIIGL